MKLKIWRNNVAALVGSRVGEEGSSREALVYGYCCDCETKVAVDADYVREIGEFAAELGWLTKYLCMDCVALYDKSTIINVGH
jgi:hypothetical protein